MKRIKFFVVAGFILLLPGCFEYYLICSLNPFYLQKNIVELPEIEGMWSVSPLKPPADSASNSSVWEMADTTFTWNIERIVYTKENDSNARDSAKYKPQYKYLVEFLTYGADSLSYSFHMVVFKVKDKLYGDFIPVNNNSFEKSRFAYESYFKVHTLARIQESGNQYYFSWLGAEEMKDMVENKRIRASYRWSESSSRMLLTGSSKQLNSFIERYAGENRFIDWENQAAMLKLTKTTDYEYKNAEI